MACIETAAFVLPAATTTVVQFLNLKAVLASSLVRGGSWLCPLWTPIATANLIAQIGGWSFKNDGLPDLISKPLVEVDGDGKLVWMS